MKTPILAVALFLATNILPATPSPCPVTAPEPPDKSCDPNPSASKQIESEIKKIAVRIVFPDNSGSGVLIGKKEISKKETKYLVLTNKHVIGREKPIKIETSDGKTYDAVVVPGILTRTESKYDIALLEFTSNEKYQFANFKYDAIPLPLDKCRTIYAAGFPFDADEIRIATGQISIRPPSIPLDNGTQIPYEIDSPSSIREGMSGGPILVDDNNGGVVLIGINTTGAAPLDRVYRFIDGTSVNPSKADKYHQANWGIPIYNILPKLRPNILDEYSIRRNVEYQIDAGDIRKKIQNQTIRIITKEGVGSGVIIAEDKKNNTYDVLTARHVIYKGESSNPNSDIKIITSRQRQYKIDCSSITDLPGVDLVMLKFTKKPDDRDEYEIASLGNYSLTEKSLVFVGGFPQPSSIYSPLWQWQMEPGKIISTERSLFATNKLLYTNITYKGMSGSPVFDLEGTVVGIHDEIELANSSGIPIKSFITAAKNLEVKDRLNLIPNAPKQKLATEEVTKLFEQVKNNILQPEKQWKSKEWLKYGQDLFRIGQYSDAVEAFKKTVEMGSDNRDKIDGFYGQAWSHEANLEYREALIAIESALILNPKDRDSRHKKIQILLANRVYDKAIDALQELISYEREKGNTNIDYLYKALGDAKSVSKDLDGAILAYSKAIELNSNNSDYFYDRGRAELRSEKDGKDERADLDLKQARELELRNVGDIRSDYIQVNKPGDNIPIHVVYIALGETKMKAIQYEQAILDFDKAIKYNRKAVYAYGYRGKAKSALKQYKEAILDFDRAIELNSEYGAAHLLRGQAKSELKDYEKAISDFKIARELFRKQGRIELYIEASEEWQKATNNFK